MDMIDRPGRGAIEMFDDFPGKVAIVTGGAGAMGASQVRKLHADGARVLISAWMADFPRRNECTVGPDQPLSLASSLRLPMASV
jgi:hypothetical protein